jgi:phosphoribosylformylglycinamidine synthase
MIWRIDIIPKKEVPSVALNAQIKDLGITQCFKVYQRSVFFIEAALAEKDIARIASSLFIDPVVENYELKKGFFGKKPGSHELLITYNAGVCDPVALSMEKAIADLSFEVKNTRTARYYKFEGLDEDSIKYLAEKILYNPLIEHIMDYKRLRSLNTLSEFLGSDYRFRLKTIEILTASDKQLLEISRNGCLSLSLEEMRILKDYFSKRARKPTDCELETIATLWSEHCAHKTFRGVIEYQEQSKHPLSGRKIKIDNLLKTTIMKATKEINSPSCISVFHDNSGIVKFDKDFNVCFKVETHNHPSSL